jgi:DNA-binding response OmpR family regulator
MKRPRVLVIEDDLHYQELLSHLLSSAGYAVTVTDSALGTASLMSRLRPRVILLDLGLPYRSGASLLADLRADARTAGIPVLVVSGQPEVLTAERRATVAGVFEKPLELRALLGAVRAACASARRDP